jgi:ornithine cyclodeaminase/alanine dehydrogenase-like protein (mu-crystallin family)
MTQTILFVNAADVRALLPMSECIDVMRVAMSAFSAQKVAVPPRLIAPLIDKSGFFALMPGSMLDPAIYGAKVVSLHPGNPAAGRPAIQGFVTLFDHATGAPIALVDGAEITAIRTAATSGLATQLLARAVVQTHGVFGCGVQAAAHIDAITSARPSIEEVIVWARSPEKARVFAEAQARRTGLQIRATTDPAEAGACDVVSAVTAATEPILKGAWLMPGAHVNLVGPHRPTEREADTEAITRASVYVDSLDGAMKEAGDLLIPIGEGAFSKERIVGEIGALADGRVGGRKDDRQITLYKSLGLVAQDLFAAWAVYERASREGRGTKVAL